MARDDELEVLLQARYDWEGAWPQEKAAYEKVSYDLVRHYVRRYNATASARRLASGRIDLAVTRMRRREVIKREGYFHL